MKRIMNPLTRLFTEQLVFPWNNETIMFSSWNEAPVKPANGCFIE